MASYFEIIGFPFPARSELDQINYIVPKDQVVGWTLEDAFNFHSFNDFNTTDLPRQKGEVFLIMFHLKDFFIPQPISSRHPHSIVAVIIDDALRLKRAQREYDTLMEHMDDVVKNQRGQLHKSLKSEWESEVYAAKTAEEKHAIEHDMGARLQVRAERAKQAILKMDVRRFAMLIMRETTDAFTS